MFVKLYTSPDCTKAPDIKKRLNDAGIGYNYFTVTNKVPYLHAENEHGSEYKAMGNTINITALKEFLGG